MANYAPNATARFVQRYSDGLHNHSHLWRAAAATTPSAISDGITSFYEAVSPLMFGGASILDASYYEENSDISVPAPPAIVALAGSGAITKAYAASSLSFIARSTGGSNFKIRLFGVRIQPTEVPGVNFRFEAGEDPNISAAIVALASMTFLRGIDLKPLVWKSYANFRVDSYWQGQSR